MSEEECRIPLELAIRTAVDLEEFVTTFDQIFSRIAFTDAGPELLMQYFLDRDVRARIAAARRVLFNSIEPILGEDATDELAEGRHRYFE